jgi:AbrB family looped-hinge helix DNA binding protein
MAALVKQATVTRKGQVTIPIDIRRRLGVEGGGAVAFEEAEGVVRLRPLRAPSLRELVAAFDPTRHRRGADERPWDDAPVGAESL